MMEVRLKHLLFCPYNKWLNVSSFRHRSRDERLNLPFVLWDEKGLRALETDANGRKGAAPGVQDS